MAEDNGVDVSEQISELEGRASQVCFNELESMVQKLTDIVLSTVSHLADRCIHLNFTPEANRLAQPACTCQLECTHVAMHILSAGFNLSRSRPHPSRPGAIFSKRRISVR